jgi:ribosomal protein S13
MRLIDSHSHLFLEEFAEDLPQVMARAREAGVTHIFMPNIDSTTIGPMLRVCREYKGYCYPMIGLHPTSVGADYEKELEIVARELASPNEFVAVGEIGMDLLTSIKGIGVTLAAALIVATGGFTYFDNAKQLTRYLGLSPIYQQFGTSVNVKGHINQNGDSNLRSQLYVAAFSSLRCNAECKACFDRLRSNGKPGKVAVVAVANKLIRQAFAVVTQGKPYVDGFKSEKP